MENKTDVKDTLLRQRNEHQTLSRTASFARGLMVRVADELSGT